MIIPVGIKQDWYNLGRIDLPKWVNYAYPHLITWLSENVRTPYAFEAGVHKNPDERPWGAYQIVIKFDDIRDAMHFKLAWGEHINEGAFAPK